MIGVLSRVGQAAAIEEFFELFKTPWEFYQEGRQYDVVVATADEIPEFNTRLLLLYGSQTKSNDVRNGFTAHSRNTGGSLNYHGIALPIYGESVKFEQRGSGSPCVQAGPGIVGLRAATGGKDTVLHE